MRRIVTIRAIVVSLGLLCAAGCASGLRNKEDVSAVSDIRWLTIQLQNEGVFVAERGQPDPTTPAVTAARLVLNSSEFLDVYQFERTDRARVVATELVGLNPNRDIYLKETMVVVRYSRRDTGLNGVLHRLLGPTL